MPVPIIAQYTFALTWMTSGARSAAVWEAVASDSAFFPFQEQGTQPHVFRILPEISNFLEHFRK